MSDTLTPEQIAELRVVVAAAKEEADENEYRGRTEGYRYSADDAMRATFTTQTLSEVLDAAEERATLRAEVEQAKRMNSELRKDVRTRDSHIEELEAENATLRAERDAALAENARLRANLAITEQHYAELADFVERTPAEEQDRELVRLQKALQKEMKS